jgi:antitoxin component YwqK of YwqJK toxin-antitoxin module
MIYKKKEIDRGMTKKPKIVKEDDLKTKLIQQGELSHKAIEKFLILDKEITRCYAFADAASPIDIFKPHKTKIKHQADTAEYFTNSVDKYREGAKDDVIYKLWDWFEKYFKDYSKSYNYLSSWEYDQGMYELNLEYIYAQKFSELPYKYVCKSFYLGTHKFVDPLTNFYSQFDNYFYARGINFSIDWKEVSTWYKTNILKLVGPFETYYANGQLKSKGNYKDGEYHGPIEVYISTGQLYTRINYKNGVEHGNWERFYANGQLAVKSRSRDGKRVPGSFTYFHENGQLFNECIENHENGQLYSKVNYKNGKRHGLLEHFDQEGKLVNKGNFKNGKEEGLHFSNLTAHGYSSKTNYKKGEKHGSFEEFYENGQLKNKRNYKNEKLDGPYEYYDENGQLRSKGNYKNEKLDGPSEYYHENGKLRTKMNHKDGKSDGPFEDYYANGQLKCKGNYKDGIFDGLSEDYYENGKLNVDEYIPF